MTEAPPPGARTRARGGAPSLAAYMRSSGAEGVLRRLEALEARSGKSPGGEGEGEGNAGPGRKPIAEILSPPDVHPEVGAALPAALLKATEASVKLLWRTVEQGLELQRRIRAGDRVGFRALREVGALQVYAEAHRAAKEILGSQLRVDEAALKMRSEETAITELLKRLEVHDRGREEVLSG